MELKYAKELDEVNRKLSSLREEKDILIRRFLQYNQNIEINAMFRALARHGGLPAAIRWYMRVYDVGILKAKKEIYALCGKRELITESSTRKEK